MHTTSSLRAALAAVLFAISPPTAAAQIYEAVGVRAQGMGGAFVAVADDATATWWNPAGLATGALFSSVVELGRTTEPSDRAGNEPAWGGRAQGFAMASPALGLSHYRLRISEIGLPPPTAEGSPDRQEGEAGGPVIRSLSARQYGVTVGQSLSSHLVIATTLKLLRGGLTSAETGAGDPMKQAEELDVRLHTRGDLDLGAMAALGAIRIGVSIKNMFEPQFGDGADRLRLGRQARMGVAVVSGGPERSVAVAFDADLTETPTATGKARHAAGGIEAWLPGRRVGLRGGLSIATAGPASRSTSVGMSLALRPSVYLDGALIRGSDRSREGWAVGLSTTY